jgi:peroxiredoxin
VYCAPRPCHPSRPEEKNRPAVDFSESDRAACQLLIMKTIRSQAMRRYVYVLLAVLGALAPSCNIFNPPYSRPG